MTCGGNELVQVAIGLFIFCTLSSNLWIAHAGTTFDVLQYGAKGNGQTDDSAAFVKAWNATCAASGDTPTLVVPAGHSFLLQPAFFQGPCKSKNPQIQILGTILAPKRSDWKKCIESSWLVFSGVSGLQVIGSASGVIDGQGSTWWTKKPTPVNVTGICDMLPTALKYQSCDGLQIRGLKQVNGPGGHINLSGSKSAIFSYLNISAPGNSTNTDGIDTSSSNQITISNSFIGVGDDCIAIKGGCSNMDITHVACGPGHGISVGSLGIGGRNDTVENIRVSNCSIIGATNGVRIKTWPGGKGYARNISFEHITVSNTENPIIIDQFYGDKGQKGEGVKVSNIMYSDIRGTSASETAITLNCGENMCSNITMDGVSITSAVAGEKPSVMCNNVQGTSTNTSPPVPCLSK